MEGGDAGFRVRDFWRGWFRAYDTEARVSVIGFIGAVAGGVSLQEAARPTACGFVVFDPQIPGACSTWLLLQWLLRPLRYETRQRPRGLSISCFAFS